MSPGADPAAAGALAGPRLEARREATPSHDPTDDPVGLIVYGVVTDESGQPIPDLLVEVRHTDTSLAADDRQRGADGYAIHGLDPGSYTVVAQSGEHLPASTPVELDGSAPGVRCDLTLQAAAQVVVHARFDDGEPFAAAPELLRSQDAHAMHRLLRPQVAEQPFGRRQPIDDFRQPDVGWLSPAPQHPDALGLLSLRRALPLHTALCLGSEVLATTTLAAGATRVDFVVPRTRMENLAATLVITVRDAASGAPIEGASISCNGDAPPTDAAGTTRIEDVFPGLHRVQVKASEDYMGLERSVDLPGGATTELDLKLWPGRELTGRVVDASGQPLSHGFVSAVQLSVTSQPPYAWIDPFRRSAVRRDGTFPIVVAADRHIVRFEDKTGRSVGHAVIDPSRSAEQPIQIVATPAVEIRPRWSGDALRALVVREASGLPIAWSRGQDTQRLRLWVAPGTYTLEIHDANRLLEARPLEVPAGLRALPLEIR